MQQQGTRSRLELPAMVVAAHDFTARTEWKDMQTWRMQMTKDHEETKRTVGKLAEAQSKMASDIASGRAENATSFDSLAKMMATMQQAIQGNQQRRAGQMGGNRYVVSGYCKVCKSTDHHGKLTGAQTFDF